MEVLSQVNGWTLYRDNKDYVQESPEGHRSKLYIVNDDEYANRKFLETIDRGWIWVEYEYFIPHVYMSKVEVEKHKAQRKSNGEIPKSRFKTKEEAAIEIRKVYPRAEEKFLKCLAALNKLREEMEFSSGDAYEGDTHGTYNDHSYISFEMEGFSFSFETN